MQKELCPDLKPQENHPFAVYKLCFKKALKYSNQMNMRCQQFSCLATHFMFTSISLWEPSQVFTQGYYRTGNTSILDPLEVNTDLKEYLVQ